MKTYKLLMIIALSVVIISCGNGDTRTEKKKLTIVTTTTMITDIVNEIGGDRVAVEGLMGAGVDPHLYKASEGDVNKLFNADIVFYNGLHLEGKLAEVFEKMSQKGVKTIALSDTLDEDRLIQSALFASNYDPHIWFDMSIWKTVTCYIASTLMKADPPNAGTYRTNLGNYLERLDSAEDEIKAMILTVPVERRILITAHDAFNYFGKAYDFEVIGLQGISTATEAGVQDVQNLAQLIVDRRVRAIFVESSVPKRNIEALQAAVKSKGFEVKIGGVLFSDACGDAGTYEGTYIGMFKHNVKTITEALNQ